MNTQLRAELGPDMPAKSIGLRRPLLVRTARIGILDFELILEFFPFHLTQHALINMISKTLPCNAKSEKEFEQAFDWLHLMD